MSAAAVTYPPRAEEAPENSSETTALLHTRVHPPSVMASSPPPDDNHKLKPAGSCNAGGPRALMLGCLLLLSVISFRLCTADNLQLLFTALQANPRNSLVLFMLLFILGIVLMLPGMILAVGAGAVYGFGPATVIVWVCTCIGQTLAFLLGRYLLRDIVSAYLTANFPNYRTMETALSREGWKLVCLLRVSPLIPYNILNYALSLTSIDLLAFALSSAVSIIPYNVLFTYVGSMSSDVMHAVRGENNVEVNIYWVSVSLAMVTVVVLYSASIAKRSVAQALAEAEEAEGSSGLQELVVGSPALKSEQRHITLVIAARRPSKH